MMSKSKGKDTCTCLWDISELIIIVIIIIIINDKQKTEEHFTDVLGADKDKVSRDQTLGNNNKDVLVDYKSGFHQSEYKHT